MKKVGVMALILCVLCTGMLFARGGTEELIKSPEEASDITKIVFLRAGTEPEKKEAFTKIIANFEAANPTIKVEYQEAPWGNDIETKLNTGFASGTAADVINFSLASMGQRIPLGQYEPLNTYAKGWEGWNDFYSSALAAGSLGDTLYGIAYLADPRLLVYNKAMFEEAGLDPNKPPRTWEEMLDYHARLIKKDASGKVIQTGLGLPTVGFNLNQWLTMFAVQNGAKNIVDDATNEILLNTPEVLEAVHFMDTIRKMGVIPFDDSKLDQNPFGNGTAAISVMSPNNFKSINKGSLEGKIAMASPLSNKQAGTFCGMHFMFMNSRSKNKDAAWKFMEFLTGKESMKIWIETLGTAPLRKSLEPEYLAMYPEEGRYVLDAISAGTGVAKVAYSNTMFNIVNESIERIFYDQATVEVAMKEAAEKLQKEIDNQ